MSHLVTRRISHASKVCSLYKRAVRNWEATTHNRHLTRIPIVLLRHEFDLNKNIKNPMVAKRLLEDGEKKLFENTHDFPIKFDDSPEGVAYQRELVTPDWVLDMWSPTEKARFPDYFARREKRKKEFVKLYESDFGRKK